MRPSIIAWISGNAASPYLLTLKKESAMSSRRRFLRETGLTAAALMLGQREGLADIGASSPRKLTILHTNDVHSRLDPFPADAGSNAGRGGVAARAALIRRIRAEEEQVLLLDAGDIFQGTPYFNMFKGEPEIKAMSAMGYEAGVMGNHDFDAGITNFADQMAAHGKFPIVMCNYDFTGTPMQDRSVPRLIIKKGGLRIGITGVGIELDGLVPEQLCGGTKYLDPVSHANREAEYLKRQKQCDLVICLSHLGDQYKDNKVSDEILARETANIDLIIGGHTHRFFDAPRTYVNKSGGKTVVNQVGWGGLRLGRLDYVFEESGRRGLDKSESIRIEKKVVD
jgi:5'-nucleotidase